MSERIRIERLLFLDDSEDESYITRLLLAKQRVRIDVVAFSTFGELDQHLDASDEPALRRSLLTVDLNLTLGSGTDVLRRIRDRSGLRLAAGVCSGSDDPADRHLALQAGADFYIGKPLNADRLRDIAAALDGFTVTEDETGLAVWRSPEAAA